MTDKIEPMPWPAALRLRCLEAASQAAIRRGIRDVLAEADRYVTWAIQPLPRPSETTGTTGASREGVGAGL